MGQESGGPPEEALDGGQEYLRSKLRAQILADCLHLVDVVGLGGGDCSSW